MKRIAPIALLPLLIPVLFGGCNGNAPSGAVILRVDGVPVTQAEFDAALEFQLVSARIVADDAEPAPGETTLAALKVKIVNEMLIPLAVVRGHFGERMPALMKKAEGIRDDVAEDRSDFNALSSEHSTPSTAQSGGRLGQLTRQSGQPYPVMQKVFSADPGTVTEPFVSLVGCHVVHVKLFVKGFSPAQDRIDADQILLAWDGNEAFMHDVLPGLVAAATVDVVDPAFKALIRK